MSLTLKMAYFSVTSIGISSLGLKNCWLFLSILTFQMSLTLKMVYFSVLP